MRCFYHRDTDAIAVCRHCGRGVCDACAAEVNKVSACRDRCEADVRALQIMVARSDTAFGTAARQLRIAAFICVLFAGLFVVLSRQMPYAMATWLLLPAAFVLLLGGLLLVLTARRYDVRSPSTNR
jgi:hypothetical protein